MDGKKVNISLIPDEKEKSLSNY